MRRGRHPFWKSLALPFLAYVIVSVLLLARHIINARFFLGMLSWPVLLFGIALISQALKKLRLANFDGELRWRAREELITAALAVVASIAGLFVAVTGFLLD